jgi:hypothetical protein
MLKSERASAKTLNRDDEGYESDGQYNPSFSQQSRSYSDEHV